MKSQSLCVCFHALQSFAMVTSQHVISCLIVQLANHCCSLLHSYCMAVTTRPSSQPTVAGQRQQPILGSPNTVVSTVNTVYTLCMSQRHFGSATSMFACNIRGMSRVQPRLKVSLSHNVNQTLSIVHIITNKDSSFPVILPTYRRTNLGGGENQRD